MASDLGRTRRFCTLFCVPLGLALVAGAAGTALAAERPFAEAVVYFEQNATDGDVEVVFDVKAGNFGLSKLDVVSPAGHRVVDFRAPDAATLGIRQFRFESPEPADVASLKAAYPEGVYTFTASTLSGDTLRGESSLDHTLPGVGSFVRPGPVVRSDERVEIAWKPVAGLSSYIVEIEQDETAMNLTVKLPASATTFQVPDGFLRPGLEYQLSLGTMTDEGNVSYVETAFETAEAE